VRKRCHCAPVPLLACHLQDATKTRRRSSQRIFREFEGAFFAANDGVHGTEQKPSLILSKQRLSGAVRSGIDFENLFQPDAFVCLVVGSKYGGGGLREPANISDHSFTILRPSSGNVLCCTLNLAVAP
jgi:hypothetical protein